MDTFEIVTIRVIHELVRPEVERLLGSEGFEEGGTLKWVRSHDAPIRQVFCFHQWKGGMIGPSWGVSLDFVPHISGSTIKWHRTPKSALLDLRVDAREGTLYMPYHLGAAPIRASAPEVVPRAVAQAREFWDRSRTVADLPAAFDWVEAYYRQHDGLGFYNFVQHPLALAFVHAMNSRAAEAMAELAKFTYYPDLSQEARDKLARLVKQGGAV